MITQQAPAQISLDFNKLRELGLKHIERLSSKLWTDYNSHDPGITILEVLCYAITDLGYRTSYDIKDILASYKGNADTSKDLLSALDILPNHPYTVKDYRKLLIDNDGIRNVWLYQLKQTNPDYYPYFYPNVITDPNTGQETAELSLSLIHI